MDPWPLSEKVRLTLRIITQTLPKKVLGSIGYVKFKTGKSKIIKSW